MTTERRQFARVAFAAGAGVSEWPAAADLPRVREQEEGVRELGISGVPTFIFDRKSGLSGAYPPDLLAQAIREGLVLGRVERHDIDPRLPARLLRGQ